jgi:protein-tyrosine phosphatase
MGSPQEIGVEPFSGAQGEPIRILFVCLGNICRSPTAEGVMRALVREVGLEAAIELDSAGTGGWHVGEPPDERATETARVRGISLEGAARQVRAEDFEDFDLIVAMDSSNLADLRRTAPDEEAREKVRLLREFDPASTDQDPTHPLDVPDPYYGGPRGFEDVLDLVGAACAGLLADVRERLGESPGGREQVGAPPHGREQVVVQPQDLQPRDSESA